MASIKKRIKPYRRFIGSITPNWLMRRKEISQGAKLCYARLCQYVGKKEKCWPSHVKLAEELGCSRHQVQRYIKELIDNELIEKKRIGLRCANRYFILEHPWMDDGITKSKHQKLAHMQHQEVTHMPHQEVAYMRHPIERDSEINDSKESNSIFYQNKDNRHRCGGLHHISKYLSRTLRDIPQNTRRSDKSKGNGNNATDEN